MHQVLPSHPEIAPTWRSGGNTSATQRPGISNGTPHIIDFHAIKDLLACAVQLPRQEKQHPAAPRANNKNKASGEGRACTTTTMAGCENDAAKGQQQQDAPENAALRFVRQQQQDGSEAPDPSGRDAPAPANNKNNGRKSAPSATTSTSRRQAYLLCRRGWIIVLNTRRSQPGTSTITTTLFACDSW